MWISDKSLTEPRAIYLPEWSIHRILDSLLILHLHHSWDSNLQGVFSSSFIVQDSPSSPWFRHLPSASFHASTLHHHSALSHFLIYLTLQTLFSGFCNSFFINLHHFAVISILCNSITLHATKMHNTYWRRRREALKNWNRSRSSYLWSWYWFVELRRSRHGSILRSDYHPHRLANVKSRTSIALQYVSISTSPFQFICFFSLRLVSNPRMIKIGSRFATYAAFLRCQHDDAGISKCDTMVIDAWSFLFKRFCLDT